MKSSRHEMHGLRYHQDYQLWQAMKKRCSNANHAMWKHYGGRGIRVCESWMKFSAFLSDMGPRPTLRHSIERINNNGNYEPSNCRWATPIDQANNARSNFRIIFNGEVATAAQWARSLGMQRYTLVARIKRLNWTVRKSLMTPVAKQERA